METNLERYDYVFQDGVKRPAHDVIWEEYYGRKLPKGHVIHHINGNGHDNSIWNLLLMTRGEHSGLHNHLRKIEKDVVDPTDPAVILSRRRCSEWAAKHPEKIKEMSKKYYWANVDRINANCRQYYEENRERIKKTEVERYYRNRDHILEQKKEYHAANRDREIAKCRAYYHSHPEEMYASRHRYYGEHRDALVQQKRGYNKEHRLLINAKMRLHNARKRGETGMKLLRREAEVLKEQLALDPLLKGIANADQV